MGWGRRILGGITRFLGEQKGGSLKTSEGFRGGITQICLENEDDGAGGGSQKSSKVIRGDHCSEVTFKGGSAKFHLVLPQILPHPSAINNDQSLRPG